jgi:hypothetical protein
MVAKLRPCLVGLKAEHTYCSGVKQNNLAVGVGNNEGFRNVIEYGLK